MWPQGSVDRIATPPVRDMQQLGGWPGCRPGRSPSVALTALQDAAAELVAGGVLPPQTRQLS